MAQKQALLLPLPEEEELNIICNEHTSLVSTLVKQAAPGEYTSQAAQRAAGIALLTIYEMLLVISSR